MALGVSAYSETPFGAEESSVIVYPLGIELTTQENSGIVSIDVDVSVTGQALTSTSGTADGSSLVVTNLTGQALTAAEGTLDQSSNQEIDVTGFDLTFNLANSTQDTLTAFGEAPFATLSPATFLIPVEVFTTVGGIVGTFPLPMSLGNVTEITGDALVTLTGFPLIMQENTPGVVGDANVSLTGFSTPLVLGTAQGFTDVTTEDVTGIGLNINLGSVVAFADVDVSVTGQAMTMQENTPTVIGDANVSVTGIGFTANLGTAELDANTLVDLTGQAMTMQEGTATAPDSLAILTGIEMTMAEGNVKNIMWSEVNTGTIQPWTEVDTAA
jgi:hypothetical protein